MDTEQHPFGEIAPLVDPDELPRWFIHEDDHLLVINKPGWLVCHPSKNGPYSSLVGAVREYLKMDTLHLVSRLDRETSGLVLIAKDYRTARKYQVAIQNGRVKKNYLALMEGEFTDRIHVDKPILQHAGDIVYIKSKVAENADDAGSVQSAETIFTPIVSKNGYTLCSVEPVTGRKHQIRAHAEWLGHRIVGDKIYGPDSTLFIDFIHNGWNPRLALVLAMARQALHCYHYTFDFIDGSVNWIAPFPQDMFQFCHNTMGLESAYFGEGFMMH